MILVEDENFAIKKSMEWLIDTIELIDKGAHEEACFEIGKAYGLLYALISDYREKDEDIDDE